MLPLRLARAAGPRWTAMSRLLMPLMQRRTFLPDSMTGQGGVAESKYPSSDYPSLADADDPEMTGGYVNPPRIKRQHRDPHADWWDKQDRRNYGEPCHDDHDMLGIFTPYEYTWIGSTRKALLQMGCFVAAVLGVLFVVNKTYPDKASYPRQLEDGLQKELGGAGAMLVSCDELRVRDMANAQNV